jgi:hypothetical protein
MEIFVGISANDPVFGTRSNRIAVEEDDAAITQAIIKNGTTDVKNDFAALLSSEGASAATSRYKSSIGCTDLSGLFQSLPCVTFDQDIDGRQDEKAQLEKSIPARW